MPFKSRSQIGYLAAKEPAIFKRWKKKYGISRGLPQKADSFKRKLGGHSHG